MTRSNKAELMETITRSLFNAQLFFICLVLPVVFVVGIKGNDTAKNRVEAQKSMQPTVDHQTVAFRNFLPDQHS